MKHIVLLITLVMSAVSFLLYGIDKKRARNHQWRISEATLLLSSLLFGGAGSLLGMIMFHHKVRKWKFRIVVPLVTILQAALLFLVLRA